MIRGNNWRSVFLPTKVLAVLAVSLCIQAQIGGGVSRKRYWDCDVGKVWKGHAVSRH